MKAQDIANAIDARVIGNGDASVRWAKSVASADEHSLVFVEEAKWLPEALASAAPVLVTGHFAEAAQGKTLLVAAQPKLAFAKAVSLLHPASAPSAGIHCTSIIDSTAGLAAEVSIGPHVCIGAGATIGKRTSIEANAVIGAGVNIGEGCVIKSNVTIYPGTELGDRVIVHSGAVLGSDGFGYVPDRTTGRYQKFPQIGKLIIGNNVEIGANSTIDRGALDATVIADGVKIDNLVHVGHNVAVGRNVVIAAQTGISGSVVIEDNVVIAGQVGIADHVRIEDGAILGAQCGVPSNKVIRGKGILFWGTPARPIREYLKELAVLSRLAKK
jgi:UDP-3-O-[3-hydroxymyristoyl] glucosamine N-acyltransferase